MASSFTEWSQFVRKNLIDNKIFIDSQLDCRKSDEDSIKNLYRYKQYIDHPINKSYNGKTSQTSSYFRKDGNQFYSKGKNKEALIVYSKSICYALSNSKELALAYANRSAVLFNMNKISLCLLDIDLAIQNSYPKELLFKVYERQGHCYQNIKQPLMATKSYKQCLDSLQYLNISKKQEIQSRINKLLEIISKSEFIENSVPEEILNEHYRKEVPLLPSSNDTYLSTSSSFSIVSDKRKGRYAVASKPIYPGEVIVVEKPYTSICIPSSFETHCYACFKRYIVCYPCRQCASVKYCSISCEKHSWNKYHQFECAYMKYLILDDIGLGHLAMKMIVETDFDILQKTILKKDNCYDNGGLNENNEYDSLDYSCVISLVGNREYRSSADLFRRSLVAVFLTKVLKLSNFFKKKTNNGEEKDNEVLVASHILKQLQMLPCNAHEISELIVTDEDYANSEPKEIGSAVYATLSLLNHSCDPSVVRHCYGDICVLRAIKHINIGEEIVDNYGFLYPVEVKEDRLKHLNEQYYFSCECIACEKDWPLYQDIVETSPECLCEGCGFKILLESESCTKCGACNKDGKIFKEINDGFQEKMRLVLNTGNFDESINYLLNYLNILSKRAVLPALWLNNCQEIVKLCFSLQANCVKLNSSST